LMAADVKCRLSYRFGSCTISRMNFMQTWYVIIVLLEKKKE
jgi:hypothetical protein